MPAAELRVFDDEDEVAREAAELFVWLAGESGRERDLFRVALSGGKTPRTLYQRLAQEYRRGLDWSRVEFYFSDERCVPPDHPESNFRSAEETLLRPLGIDPRRTVRMEGEAVPDEAADRYEKVMRDRFQVAPPAWPRFDLILLGLGEDAHIASLFPHSAALKEGARAVVATKAPHGVPDRLSFTVPLINQARQVLLLVTGEAKAGAVRAVFDDESLDPFEYPAKLLRGAEGRVSWFLDRAAASQLALSKQQLEGDEA
ncbi:6-phosphogluconolactonase [Candidatus Nitrospira bockiana]